MKKIFFSLIFMLILMQPSFALAKDATHTATQRQTFKNEVRVKISEVSDQRVNDLKQRADREIDRRVTSLTALISKINLLKKLTTTQKSDLTSKVQTQIDSLTTLKTKIDADADLPTLKADVKPIIDSYRIFLVLMPKVRLLAAADRLAVVASDLSVVSTKLQARISSAQSLGKDVSQLNTWISDLNSKVADAQSVSNSITEEVLSLTPQGYPGNKSTLEDGRNKLKTGNLDIRTARQDGFNIIKQLKLWGGTSATVTPTP